MVSALDNRYLKSRSKDKTPPLLMRVYFSGGPQDLNLGLKDLWSSHLALRFYRLFFLQLVSIT